MVLQANGAPEQQLVIRTLQPPGSSKPLDMAVAARDLAAGEVALSVPEQLTVTLDRIFESDTVAELLTTGRGLLLAAVVVYCSPVGRWCCEPQLCHAGAWPGGCLWAMLLRHIAQHCGFLLASAFTWSGLSTVVM